MIHFAIGTKAQFIKMAPVMCLLQEEEQNFHLLDLSQHGSLTGKILSDFGLNPVITHLGRAHTSITTYTQAMKWLAHGIWQIVAHKHNLRKRLFLGQEGVVLLHGDTLSTLLGLYLARAAGLKSALVEAGLSSGNLFDPFPEEWIRRHTGRKVDFLFPPDAASESWLRNRNFQCQTINTGYNTGRDSLYLIADRHKLDRVKPERGNFHGIVTLHRVETLSNKRRLVRVVRHIIGLAKRLGGLRFFVHPPTKNALKKTGLLQEIKELDYIELLELEPYPDFIRSLMKARFVLTDGGSIQEEASYLRKPCLILRNRTERNQGIGNNAILSTWSIEQDYKYLLRKIEENIDYSYKKSDMYASRIILRALNEFRTSKKP